MMGAVWAVETFGQLGGALVTIAMLIGGVLVARYAFWTIVALLMIWHIRRGQPTHTEGNR